MRTIKAQPHRQVRAFVHCLDHNEYNLEFSYLKFQLFSRFCGLTSWFEVYLVGKPESRCDMSYKNVSYTQCENKRHWSDSFHLLYHMFQDVARHAGLTLDVFQTHEDTLSYDMSQLT